MGVYIVKGWVGCRRALAAFPNGAQLGRTGAHIECCLGEEVDAQISNDKLPFMFIITDVSGIIVSLFNDAFHVDHTFCV